MMLCETGSEKDLDKCWIANRKFDGCRCLAFCDEQVNLIGRNGTNYTSKFPEIVNELKGFRGIFDGEICCDTFEHTSSRVHTENKLKLRLLEKQYPATYHIFDVLKLDIVDLTNDTLIKRVEILAEMPLISKKYLKLVENYTNLKSLWETAKNENWEGIIIKNPNSRYEKRRSRNWLKIKYIKSKDIIFNKFEQNTAGVRIESDCGIAIQVSGSNSYAVKDKILKEGSALIEVNYLNETGSGLLRMPTFKTLK